MTSRPRDLRGRTTRPSEHFERESSRRAWATVRPRSRGTTHRALCATDPATPWLAGAAPPPPAAGAGAAAAAAGAGGGTGAGVWRSGASSHGGPGEPREGCSGAPPPPPGAGARREQAGAGPLSGTPVALAAGFAAARPGRRDLAEAVGRGAILGDHVAARVGLLAGRHVELRMVERRGLLLHARVGERLEELDEVVLVLLAEVELLDVAGLAHVVEVAAAAVEVDDLAQRHLAAVVEVRRRQLDVPQAGDLERPVDRERALARQLRNRERLGGRSAVVAADA